MIKHAPSPARIAAMVTFALSCFGIVLFLWTQFGGPLPLKPEGYRVKAAFPEAIGLVKDVDVRTAGITIGTVRDVKVEHETGRGLATLVLDSEYAPLARDARAILRRKTLLGETFVEITTGSKDAPKIPDGGRLADSRIEPTVELDEILQTWDPVTRRAFQMWQQELSKSVGERGEELNNALGHLPEFAESGADLLSVLDEHERSLRGLVRDTGEVYAALTQDESQLANLIRGSHGVFRQTAAERESLAEAIGIFPTFLDESKTTLKRLEGFSREARPLVRDLRPVARELRPTVPRVRRLAPHLRKFFLRFDDQIRASRPALPALRETLDETRPLFASLGPFLGELNPIIQWLELNQQVTADFLGYSAGALADTVPGVPAGEVGHYLRQLGVTGIESLGIHQDRVSSNRGNAYLPPVIPSSESARRMMIPSWDCKPSGGEVESKPAQFGATVACWVAPPTTFKGRAQPFPHVGREDYGR